MDVNAALTQARQATEQAEKARSAHDKTTFLDIAVDLYKAIDASVSQGKSLPEEWKH